MNQDNIPFGAGAVKSIEDLRDQLYRDRELTYAYPFPTVYETDFPGFLPENIKNQRSIGICTASLSYYIEYLYWKKTGTYTKLSMAFLYLITKKYIDGNETEGSSCRSALKAAQKYGICTEATFPSNTALSYEDFMKQTVPQAAMNEALNYRIGQYSQIPIEESLMAGAIYKYGLLYAMVHIDSHWWTPSWLKSDIDPLQPPTGPFTGHAINFSGYDASAADTKERGVNTWSLSWNDIGKFDMSYAKYSPSIVEAWVATLDPVQPAKVDNSPQLSSSVWRGVLTVLRKIGLIQ